MGKFRLRGIGFLFWIGIAPFLSTTAWCCEGSLKKYPFECEIRDRYQKIKSRFWTEYSVDVEYLSEYRATRLIDQWKWDQEKEAAGFCPWPIYQPAPLTWDRWEKGANLVKLWVERGLEDPEMEFNLDNVQDLHRLAIDPAMIRFFSWFFKGARPGQIRTPSLFMRKTPEFFIRCEDRSLEKKVLKF